MTPTFFARRSLLILVIIFFLIPFGLRGARLALRSMKNDIKDWLPSDFKETSELDWFRENFLGEQFVIFSWEGCSEDDERLKLLAGKLLPEYTPVPDVSEEEQDRLAKAEAFVRENCGLYLPEDCFQDWGGQNEKWFQGRGDKWFYLTPDGKLYEWHGQSTVLAWLGRKISRMRNGKSVDGELMRELAPIDYERPYRIETPLFKTVTTGPQILEKMSREGGPLRRGEERTEEEARELALERLEGILFGPDKKQTSVIVTLTDAGKDKLERVVGRGLPGHPRGKLIRLAEESGVNPPARPPLLAIPSLGIGMPEEPPAPSLKMGGPPIDNVAIDEEGQITLVRLVGLCAILGIGLAFYCFRSLYVTVMLFFVGGVSAICSLGAVWWLGSSVDAVLMSMPAVVYVLGLSGAVHIVNYYRDAIEEHGIVGAPERAVAHGWLPCTLAAITTAIGLGSLCTSELKPIYKFGLFSAIGVVGTLILLFTYLPAALQTWPPTLRLRTGPSARKPSPLETGFLRWVTGLGNGIIRYNVATAIVCAIGFGVLGFGLLKMTTSVHLIKMFATEAKIISDYRWLENNIGKLVPMELVIRFDERVLLSTDEEGDKAEDESDKADKANKADAIDPLLQYSMLDRLDAAARAHQVIEEEFGPDGNGIVGRAMSVASLTPPLPEPGGGFRQAIYRNTFSRQIEEHRQEFIDSDYLRDDQKDGAELWRVSIRLAALKDIDYGARVADFQCAVEPIMAAYRYRGEILSQINDDNEGDGFGRTQVLVLGLPYEKYRQEAEKRAEAEEAEQVATDETTAKEQAAEEDGGDGPVADAPALVEADFGSTFEHHEVDQSRIFALTLKDLLVNARLRFQTHDPTHNTAEELEAELADAAYVIFAADHSSYDVKALRKRLADRMFDVRDHVFDPATDNSGESYVAGGDVDAPDVATIYTGVVPVVYKAQRTLLNNLVVSFLWAFGLIMVVMMFVLRSPTAAFVSMFPNVFPVAVVFGAMGWLGISIDIGTMMTASVAMGVAVDDTIHFLTWYRWGLDSGLSRQGAIREAYRRVARAMAQTTAIGGLGMAVFALSTFTPTQRFGVLMLALLCAALVGDLVFLPALLASPLGKLFSPSSKDKKRRISQPSEPVVGDDIPHTDETDDVTPSQAKGDVLPDAVAAGDSSGTGGPPTPHVAGPASVSAKHQIVRHDGPHNVR